MPTPRESAGTDKFTTGLQDPSPFLPFYVVEMTRDNVITGSLIRTVIGVSEGASVTAAKKFFILAKKAASKAFADGAATEEQTSVAHALLEHLKLPPTFQEKKPSIARLVPLTPALAQVTAFARPTTNTWNPGGYLKGMVLRGSDSRTKAQELWVELGNAFAIRPWTEERNDIWAVLIEKQIKEHFSKDLDGNATFTPWTGEVKDNISTLNAHLGPDKLGIRPCPARSFVNDLRILTKLEPLVTRRQWISILDCFLRLALASDLLWIGYINQGLHSLLDHHLKSDDAVPPADAIAEQLLPAFRPITNGEHVDETLKREIRRYFRSRLYIRFLLDELRSKHKPELQSIKEDSGGLNSLTGIGRLLELAREHGDSQLSDRVLARVRDVLTKEPDLWQCKGGTVTKNTYECIRHALGQRATRNAADTHFDQGFWCKKNGRHRGASWLFEPGPVALITFAHLACSGPGGLGTATDFRNRLAAYGVSISQNELNNGKIGRDIRSLGLVIDSPDAEGGMLIRSPFTTMDPSK